MGAPHTKHRRRSKFDTELPVELRQEVNRILIEGATYEEACAYCAERGYEISRSAMGRHGKAFFEAYQAVLQFEDQSRALKGATDEGLSMEEATTKLLLQKVMARLIDGSLDVLEMPRIISDVAKLQSSSIQREKWKAEIEKRVAAAAASVAKTVQRAGLSDEVIDEIRREILGVVG